MADIRKREIIGTGVSMTNYDEVLVAFDAAIKRRQKIYVCCAPASSLIYARRDPKLAAALLDANIVTPDGMGVVFAARLMGERLPDRVYGPDLMLLHLERVAKSGGRVWLYGGHNEAALNTLRGKLKERFPDLQIVGAWSPPHRSLTEAEAAEVMERINSDAPDVLWVGLGTPKQDIWMRQFRDRLDVPVICGVGAAFDFHAERISQAPVWMQRIGLEWLFRLSHDPARMLRRYATTLPAFAVLVIGQAIRGRLRLRR